MTRYTLEEDISFNFNLIGISSHFHDYRVCWAINKSLDFELERSESEIIVREVNKELLAFSTYIFICSETEVMFELISNRNADGFLIPEMKQADYFLKLDDFYPESTSEIVRRLSAITMVNMAFEIDVETLRSKYNLIY